MSADPWSVLGVPSDATDDAIKKAFRRIARQSHPDVAGDDPSAAARFAEARRAYETLMDPAARARAKPGAAPARGSFFEAFYRRTGRGSSGLDDLVADFGTGTSRSGGRGSDVSATVEVPADVAARGGTVDLRYPRRRPSMFDQMETVDEVAPIRIAPGTPDGAVLREKGRGNVGDGGAGDLIVTVRVIPSVARWLDVSVTVAFLGGAVRVGGHTVEVPPGTSSGTRLAVGPETREVRIVAPATLDAESVALLEAFGRRNP